MKYCSKCQAILPLDRFHNNVSRPDGKSGWCKDCMYPALQIKKVNDNQYKRYIEAKERWDNWIDLPNEQWQDIANYKGLYQVSDCSRIRSIKRGPVLLVAPVSRLLGYRYVGLGKKTHYLHRIVAAAWIPNPNNYKIVNHKNGDKSDASITNLEWCSAKQNTTHAIKTLQRHGSLNQSRTPKCLQTDEIRKQINRIYYLARKKTKETGIQYVVDHIYPLNGENSWGLHVPWNLQIITKLENEQKNNKVY